ncbi:Hypothetical protein NTJ_14016 [Nesidiocoris tenuis]|uniref:Small VCP/p97-interacting protein n=1 Tax=Nesidiocoris tenuis TaxID=355587 RepID=A0ABN7B9Y3_9HEMI|nr:Hypothetical protein NTJ_14016 [Nesidiocoris tenuis]
MGSLCSSCFGSKEESEYLNPDPEERRRQMAEAAERRAQESQSRGIKDPEKVKRMQQKAEERERLEREVGNQQGNLKWQV